MIIIFFFIFGVGAAIYIFFVHIICISVHCSSYQLNTASDGPPRILPGGKNGP